MSSSVRKSAAIKAIDPVWDAVRAGAQQIVTAEPSLANMVVSAILNHDTFEQALAHRLAARLNHDDVSADLIRQAFAETLSDAPEIGEKARVDLAATLERDPACHRAIEPLLFFKGYQAIQTHRFAHAMFKAGRRDFLVMIYAIMSRNYHAQKPMIWHFQILPWGFMMWSLRLIMWLHAPGFFPTVIQPSMNKAVNNARTSV